MKAYKIRSLIFFSCFVIAAIVYYQFEQQENFKEQFNPSEVVDLETEDAESLEEDELLQSNYPD
ncbi:hypothetical protein [Croceivirga thetidis]|uniref:Secreted protein n=1 Tax=Croceivirga thetidis TaxID=2721623 RepID=A0ABX1GPJ3_9FLAO|nr:hypothetical protein [Croceivirga thetidis]NKI31835.1 hypothetical protein [Croceivirga thetidis]